MTSKQAIAVRMTGLGILAGVLTPVMYATNGVAALVSRLGISLEVAGAIITLLTSGGAVAVAAIYPLAAPFLGTAEVLVAVWGAATAVSF
jgi:hypothetical protein